MKITVHDFATVWDVEDEIKKYRAVFHHPLFFEPNMIDWFGVVYHKSDPRHVYSVKAFPSWWCPL